MHCTAGRDRTSLVTVLLLAVVGVPAPDIAADNEASTNRFPALFAKLGTPEEAVEIQAALDCHRTTISAEVTDLLTGMDVDSYLRAAGVTAADLHGLRGRLLGSAGERP